MNRKQRREFDKISKAEGARKQKLGWDAFKEVTLESIKKHQALTPDSDFKANQVFQNNKYIVQVFWNVVRKGKVYDQVMIRRSDAKPIYSWQDLYRIKNEVFGDEVEAIQFFPPKRELIDVANLYWIFIPKN